MLWSCRCIGDSRNKSHVFNPWRVCCVGDSRCWSTSSIPGSSCIKTHHHCWNVYDLKNQGKEGQGKASAPPSHHQPKRRKTLQGDPLLPKTFKPRRPQRIDKCFSFSLTTLLSILSQSLYTVNTVTVRYPGTHPSFLGTKGSRPCEDSGQLAQTPTPPGKSTTTSLDQFCPTTSRARHPILCLHTSQ